MFKWFSKRKRQDYEHIKHSLFLAEQKIKSLKLLSARLIHETRNREMVKVIFMPRKVPSSHLPIEYYVDTNNYETAEMIARVELEKDKPEDHESYDQVVIAQITPLKVTHD